MTAALIASLVLSANGVLKKVLNFRVLTWLGAISYSVYMSHFAIEWVAGVIVRRVSNKPEIIGVDGISISQLTGFEALFACLAVVMSVLVVSAFVYNFIEKPMRERSRRLVFGKFK